VPSRRVAKKINAVAMKDVNEDEFDDMEVSSSQSKPKWQDAARCVRGVAIGVLAPLMRCPDDIVGAHSDLLARAQPPRALQALHPPAAPPQGTASRSTSGEGSAVRQL
jgi:hypothetical protein